MIRTSVAVLSLGLVITACSPPSTEPAAAPEATQPEIDQAEETVSDEMPATPVPGLIDSNGIETKGYPDGWELQPFWSGEYPNAFSVPQESVTVMGHQTITYGDTPTIDCTLPHKATYSPWNGARRELDNLEFVALVYPTMFEIMEDVSVEAFVGDGTEPLDLKTGDQLIYKSYLAEGFFIAEKDGVQYEINEGDLPASTDFQQGPEDQEWLLVTCDDAEKTRAWILFDDALTTPGTERYDHTSFGEAADLP